MDKFFCYVDETGQDTRGGIFIVALIVTSKKRELLELVLENAERRPGKGRKKWAYTPRNQRIAYM